MLASTSFATYKEPADLTGASPLDGDCSVCLENLRKGTIIGHPNGPDKNLDHLIHETCMKEWIKKQGHNCPSCRAETNPADFLTPEELEAREADRRRELANARAPLRGYSPGAIVLLGAGIAAAAFGGVFVLAGPIVCVALGIFQGIAAAGEVFWALAPLAIEFTLLGAIGGAAGTIMGIAVARFFGHADGFGIFGAQVGAPILGCCDLQIKSIALGILGVAGIGAGAVAVGLAAKGAYYLATNLYSRYNSQVPAQ